MSLQVCAAGSSSVPCPSRLTPTSFTTMLAPSRAMHSANSRPMPRPDPVTTATRPSRIPMGLLSSSFRLSLLRRATPEGAAGLLLERRGGRAGELDLTVAVRRRQLEVDRATVAGAGRLATGPPRGEGQGLPRPHLLGEPHVELSDRFGPQPVLDR